MKKIVSILAAITICSVFMSSINTSAYLGVIGDDEYDSIKSNFESIDSAACIGAENSTELYMKSISDKRVEILCIEETSDKVVIEFKEPMFPDDFRVIRDYIYNNYSELRMSTASSSGSEPLRDTAVVELYNITSDGDVQTIYNKISSFTQLSRFDYYDLKKSTDAVVDLLLYEKKELPKIESFLSENNINYSLENAPEYNSSNGESYYYIIPDDVTSVFTKLELANMIQNELNIYTRYGLLESYGNIARKIKDITDFQSQPPTYIEESELSGDANLDGIMNMADAVLILQYYSLPDVYGINGTAASHIKEQGLRNADVNNSGDGVTPADALTIQRRLLGLEG